MKSQKILHTKNKKTGSQIINVLKNCRKKIYVEKFERMISILLAIRLQYISRDWWPIIPCNGIKESGFGNVYI